MEPNPVVRELDPPCEAGPFKLYRRTDGLFAVVDRSAPVGKGTVHVAMSEGEGREKVKEHAERAASAPAHG